TAFLPCLGALSFSPRFTFAAGDSALPTAFRCFFGSGAAFFSRLPLFASALGAPCLRRAAADFLSAISVNSSVLRRSGGRWRVMDGMPARPFFSDRFKPLEPVAKRAASAPAPRFAHVFSKGWIDALRQCDRLPAPSRPGRRAPAAATNRAPPREAQSAHHVRSRPRPRPRAALGARSRRRRRSEPARGRGWGCARERRG